MAIPSAVALFFNRKDAEECRGGRRQEAEYPNLASSALLRVFAVKKKLTAKDAEESQGAFSCRSRYIFTILHLRF